MPDPHFEFDCEFCWPLEAFGAYLRSQLSKMKCAYPHWILCLRLSDIYFCEPAPLKGIFFWR